MASLVVGSIFARDFRVVRPLGQGGMGSVYVVEQLSTGNLRALKLMHPQLVQNVDLRRRFEQESRVGSRIHSEHVVQVVGAGVDDVTQTPYIAMEMLQGEDVAAALRRRGPFSIAETRDVLMQMTHALAAAHAAGIVHRDMKPENVFLAVSQREGGTSIVKVLDFGIAKVVADAKTAATAAIGTPLWMSPEQTAMGAQIGPQADVWSVGLIAFTMLTGRLFWQTASTPNATTAMLLREIVMDPIPPASVRAAQLGAQVQLPPGFDQWFARCLAREPSQRFANAGEARAAFAQMTAGMTPMTAYAQPPAAYAQPPMTSPYPAQLPGTIAQAPLPHGATPVGFGASAPGMAAAAANAPPGASAAQVKKKGSSLPLVLGAGAALLVVLAIAGVVVTKKVSASRAAKECDDSAANASATNAPALAEACRVTCESTPGIACVLHGDLVRRFRLGDKWSDVALASYDKGCDAKAASGCRRVGNVIESKEPKRAAELYANACNAGDAAACTAQAVMLELGLGVARDGTKAASLYEAACKANDALSCAYHAFMLEAGRGVKRDEKRVADLLASTLPGLEKACDRGEMRECVALGFAIENAPSKPDAQRAAVLYQRACEDGVQSGCSNLATLNFLGRGVFKDLQRAVSMFEKACEGGEPSACTNLGIIRAGTSFGLRHGVRGVTTFKLTCEAQFQVGCAGWGMLIKVPPDLPPGPTVAVALSKKGCDGGDLVACVNLGAFHQAALGTTKNRQLASELFKKACDAGNAGGCGEYGTMYLTGRGVPLDGKRALDLLTQACEWGELDACTVAGDVFALGFEGIPKNPEKAAQTYKRYCDEGKVSGACTAYAGVLVQGNGVKKDAPAAIALFKAAANGSGYDKPYIDAYADLGNVYEQGLGVMRDYAEAASYFRTGCDAGSLKSCAGYARLLADGLGVARDPDKARQLAEHGCKVGEGQSCGTLAVFYLFGKAGLTNDGERGISLYKELCDDGDWGACGNVGVFLVRGLGVKMNREEGAQYLRKSCAHNTEWACTEMKRNAIAP